MNKDIKVKTYKNTLRIFKLNLGTGEVNVEAVKIMYGKFSQKDLNEKSKNEIEGLLSTGAYPKQDYDLLSDVKTEPVVLVMSIETFIANAKEKVEE